MKRIAIVGSLGVLALAALVRVEPVEAHKHAVGGHRDHVWSDDSSAYRSFRDADPRDAVIAGFGLDLATVEPIDGDYLESSLRILAGESDTVMTDRGSDAGRAAAREFLRREFESHGFAVSEENYGRGVNLIAERSGRSGKFLVVSAHYDSVDNPGADDDGTGVAAMLATAKLIGSRDLENGVRFVAFDQEELGLIGSAAYVKALVDRGEKDTLLGDLQLEMMGYNARKDGKFHVISCDRADSRFLANAYRDVVGRMEGLKITSACTDRSDHSSFWDHDIPAIVVSENFFGGDSNPCYHRSCDKTDILDFGYFTKVAQASANVALQLATTEVTSTPGEDTGSDDGKGSSWPSSARRRR